MAKAEARVKETGALLRDGAQPMMDEATTTINPVPGATPRARNMIIPIAAMVILMPLFLIYTGWAEMKDNRTLTVCKSDGVPEDIVFEDSPYPHMGSITGEMEEFALAAEGKATYRISPEEMIHNAEVLAGLITSAETGNRITFS